MIIKFFLQVSVKKVLIMEEDQCQREKNINNSIKDLQEALQYSSNANRWHKLMVCILSVYFDLPELITFDLDEKFIQILASIKKNSIESATSTKSIKSTDSYEDFHMTTINDLSKDEVIRVCTELLVLDTFNMNMIKRYLYLLRQSMTDSQIIQMNTEIQKIMNEHETKRKEINLKDFLEQFQLQEYVLIM